MSEASPKIDSDATQLDRLKLSAAEQTDLRQKAIQAARSCGWLGGHRRSRRPRQIYQDSTHRLAVLQQDLLRLKSDEPSEDLKWLYDNLRLIRTDLQGIRDSLRNLSALPLVRTSNEE